MHTFYLIFPIFAILATGWLCRVGKILRKESASSLMQYVFYLAAPALIIQSLGKVPFASIWNGTFVVTFGGALFGFYGVLIASFLMRKHSMASAVLQTLNLTNTMTLFLGIPLAISLFGHRGVVPMLLSLLLTLLLRAISIYLLETFRDANTGTRRYSKGMWNTLKNPLLISSILGMGLSLTAISLPKVLEEYLRFFAASLTPCALFAVGLQTTWATFHRRLCKLLLFSSIKLVFFPLVVFFLVWSAGLKPIWAVSAVLSAALPSGKVNAILAGVYAPYQKVEEEVFAMISLTSLLGIPSLMGWLYFLDYMYSL